MKKPLGYFEAQILCLRETRRFFVPPAQKPVFVPNGLDSGVRFFVLFSFCLSFSFWADLVPWRHRVLLGERSTSSPGWWLHSLGGWGPLVGTTPVEWGPGVKPQAGNAKARLERAPVAFHCFPDLSVPLPC